MDRATLMRKVVDAAMAMCGGRVIACDGMVMFSVDQVETLRAALRDALADSVSDALDLAEARSEIDRLLELLRQAEYTLCREPGCQKGLIEDCRCTPCLRARINAALAPRREQCEDVRGAAELITDEIVCAYQLAEHELIETSLARGEIVADEIIVEHCLSAIAPMLKARIQASFSQCPPQAATTSLESK